MIDVGEFWIDKNNNFWSKDYYTIDQAKKHSESLKNCYNCQDCQSCRNCQDCQDCQFCQFCRFCRNCQDCRNCHNFSENPNRYAIKNLGSKWKNTCIYWTSELTQVICGCFRGSIDEFKKAVIAKYGSDHGYIKYAEMAEILINKEF